MVFADNSITDGKEGTKNSLLGQYSNKMKSKFTIIVMILVVMILHETFYWLEIVIKLKRIESSSENQKYVNIFNYALLVANLYFNMRDIENYVKFFRIPISKLIS